MDFHSTFESLAEAWVATNTPSAVNLQDQKTTERPVPINMSSLPTEAISDDDEDDTNIISHHSLNLDTTAGQHHHHHHHHHHQGGNLSRATPSPSCSSSSSSSSTSPVHRSVSTTYKPSPIHTTSTPPPSMARNSSPSQTAGGSVCRKSAKNTNSKNTEQMAIRCSVEYVNGPDSFDSSANAVCDVTEVDKQSFATLPSNTPWLDIVPATLHQLGYNPSDTAYARGSVIVKNWKPQPVESITDDTNATIHDILKEINDFRLSIRLFRRQDVSATWGEHSVRCAVFSLLKYHSQSSLAKLSPLSQSTISAIANNKYKNHLSTEKCQDFGRWYTNYATQIDFVARVQRMPVDCRMTFHPDHELPLMRSWYQTFTKPSDAELASFALHLNSSHVRQNKTKVSIQKLKTWWRNEQQRLKQLQQCAQGEDGCTTKLSKTKSTSSTPESQFHGAEKKRKGEKHLKSKTLSQESALKHGTMKRLKVKLQGMTRVTKDAATQHILCGSRTTTDIGSAADISSSSVLPMPHSVTTSPPPSTSFIRPAAQRPPRKTTLSEIDFSPCQGQNRNLLPGLHSLARPSARERADNSSSQPAMLAPWQKHFPFMVHQRERVEREMPTSDNSGFDRMDNSQYSKSMSFDLPNSKDFY